MKKVMPGTRVLFLLATEAGRSRVQHLDNGHDVEGVDSLSRADLMVYDGSPDPDILSSAAEKGVATSSLVDFYSSVTGRLPVDLVDPDWLREKARRSVRTRAWRVLLDRCLGILLLILSAPLQLAIATAIAVAHGRPVLIRQERLRQGKKPFTLFKFRTMARDAEANGPQWTYRDDPRVFALGRFLRRFHLDELPQFLNMARGDLALIGPRPIRQPLAERLTRIQPLFELRFCHRQGLTGWAQITAPSGANDDEQMIKLEADLFYLTYGTWRHDLKVLGRTILAVALGSGV